MGEGGARDMVDEQWILDPEERDGEVSENDGEES